MTIDELNTLLEELTHDDLTTDRLLEICGAIRSDKETSLNESTDLNDKLLKLQDDYKALKKKAVDDFFNKGVEMDKNPELENTSNEETLEVPSYDELVESEA